MSELLSINRKSTGDPAVALQRLVRRREMEMPDQWLGGLDGNPLTKSVIEQIQFDAWVQGMTEAANLIVQFSELGELTPPVTFEDLIQRLHTETDFAIRQSSTMPNAYDSPNEELSEQQDGLCVHTLKTWPVYFEALWDGEKMFEVRKNDRNYKAGDRLILQEYDPEAERYLDREIHAEVTYRMPGGRWGVADDYCVMALRVTKKRFAKTPND